jgi:hypothetical protein
MGAAQMAELFLSYAHQDVKFAEMLAQLLEAGGLTVWWDRRMVAGDKINDVIDEELEKANKSEDELQKLAKILSDKFKPAPPLKPGVPQPTAAKIEFTGNSVGDFFAKLGAERAAYKSVWTEGWAVSAIKKHPVGAALQIGLVVLVVIYFLGYTFLQAIWPEVPRRTKELVFYGFWAFLIGGFVISFVTERWLKK